MNYQQTLEFLYQQLPVFHRIGAAAYKANLDKTIFLDGILRNPALAYPSVHIAGTNGKGSVSNLLASALQAAGYKTGLFTSPHLLDFRERIRVNGKKITRTFVTGFIEEHMPAFEKIQPSFFEMTFALATDYFRSENIDIAVFETGMGGRLDSTNIISPLLSVITNIGNDHSQFLGDTIEKIATEKAGIIKPGIPVVIGQFQQDIFHVFEERAKELNSPLYVADHGFTTNNIYNAVHSGYLNCNIVRSTGELFASVSSALNALYQLKNLVTTAQSVDLLNSMGYRITHDHFSEGVYKVRVNTGFGGRWQKISFHPRVYCDIAHNTDGISELLHQIKSIYYQNLFFVFGMVMDKDHSGVLRLLPSKAYYFFCKPGVPRGMDAKELHEKARQEGLKGEVSETAMDALDKAKNKAGKNDLIIVTGSTFVVADILGHISHR